jgi:biopolymer transport protein ExbD
VSFNPSKRMKGEEEGELNLNLNPMMDMFAVLIPALLMMSVVVEISVINVSAPSIGGGDTSNQKPPDKPPLNLTVTITDLGFAVSTTSGPIPGPDGSVDPKKPTIPVAERTILCSKFRGTRPPPRNRNADRAECPKDDPYARKSFIVYDLAALTKLVTDLKDKYPDERRIIIGGTREVEFEAVVDVMDATRDYQEKNGDIKPLFDEVVLSPGM